MKLFKIFLLSIASLSVSSIAFGADNHNYQQSKYKTNSQQHSPSNRSHFKDKNNDVKKHYSQQVSRHNNVAHKYKSAKYYKVPVRSVSTHSRHSHPHVVVVEHRPHLFASLANIFRIH